VHTDNHIPLQLMETFVKIVDNGGDATAAAQELGISQPSISKRLSALRRIVEGVDERPWLILKGKRWVLTPGGERVRGVVTELVRKYEQVEQFIADTSTARPRLSVACGQTAASGFVRLAVERFLETNPHVQIRVSMIRGRSRIEGVAGGQFDLAIVTDSESMIRDIAGIELFVESISMDRLVLAANPAVHSAWAKGWESLPVRRPLTAKEIASLPLILPEPDAGRRQQFDQWFANSWDQPAMVAMEVGGWQNILGYVQSGIGVGLVSEQAVKGFSQDFSGRSAGKARLSVKMLDEQTFTPAEIRVIARKQQGRDTPDLGSIATQFYELVKEFAPTYGAK
jgi:LysR family transcriptional regulator, positive regulator for ilvC